MSLHMEEGTSVTVEADANKTLAVPYVDQFMTHWCWAACAEMVFTFKEMSISKCDVIAKDLMTIFGVVNDPTIQQPCASSPSEALPSSNVMCMSNTPSYTYNCWFGLPCTRQDPGLGTAGITNLIKDQIDQSIPLHIQDSFHAIVITGYHADDAGNLIELYILDPDSGTGIAWQNFDDPDYFDWPHTTFFYDFGKASGFPC